MNRLRHYSISQFTRPGLVTESEHRAWLYPAFLVIGRKLGMNAHVYHVVAVLISVVAHIPASSRYATAGFDPMGSCGYI